VKVKLFCVLDAKLNLFNTPMAFQSQGLAHRAFQDEVNREDKDNPMHKYPEDFSLYYVGDFDSAIGCFVPPSKGIPELVANGRDVKL